MYVSLMPEMKLSVALQMNVFQQCSLLLTFK